MGHSFGNGMENVDVSPSTGAQKLVLYPEMECTNTFPNWDFGTIFYSSIETEVTHVSSVQIHLV